MKLYDIIRHQLDRCQAVLSDFHPTHFLLQKSRPLSLLYRKLLSDVIDGIFPVQDDLRNRHKSVALLKQALNDPRQRFPLVEYRSFQIILLNAVPIPTGSRSVHRKQNKRQAYSFTETTKNGVDIFLNRAIIQTRFID